MIGVVIRNGFVYSCPHSTSQVGINFRYHTHYVDDNVNFVGMCMVVILFYSVCIKYCKVSQMLYYYTIYGI